MRVVQVKVEKLYTYGNYQNITFSFTANLDLGESPNIVIDQLNEYCDTQFAVFQGRLNDYEDLKTKIRNLKNETAELESLTREAENKFNKVKSFMDKLGINCNSYIDDIPF